MGIGAFPTRFSFSAIYKGFTPMSDAPLLNKRILAFVGDIYEDLELWYPKLRLIEAGAEFLIAGEEANRTYSGKNGYPCLSDLAIADVRSADFDAVLLPGGFMPDRLRRLDSVKNLISEFHRDRKCIAAICHGGWLAISAQVYRGVRVTGSLGIKDDLIHAGALWEDARVVVDRHFVSSRKPDDLPWFVPAMIDVMLGSSR
jgi:protease I